MAIGVWHSYDKENVWLSFDALKVTHRFTEMIWGTRYSTTLYTSIQLEHLITDDGDNLRGFPIYLYNPESLKTSGTRTASFCFVTIQRSHTSFEQGAVLSGFQAKPATSSTTQHGGADRWQNIPLPSIADVKEQHVMDLKIFLDWCRCVKAFNQEHRFPIGIGQVRVTHARVSEYCAVLREELLVCCPLQAVHW